MKQLMMIMLILSFAGTVGADKWDRAAKKIKNAANEGGEVGGSPSTFFDRYGVGGSNKESDTLTDLRNQQKNTPCVDGMNGGHIDHGGQPAVLYGCGKHKQMQERNPHQDGKSNSVASADRSAEEPGRKKGSPF